ncbi:MAG TPA: TonB-dependent receptor [Vicinamibacteria bacterium]
MKLWVVAACLALACFAGPAGFAQEATPSPSPAPPAEPTDEETIKREEVVVVTASKVESTIINAPATMTVVTTEALQTAPSQNFGDLMRNVPGMNVIQTSARDVNITSRQSTSTLATSQLVLLDGRSMYLDFFGLVLWDLVPNNAADIKQIEVVRGPASAVWGANALSGVVNIITKTPREAPGSSVTLTGGLFNRDEGSREEEGTGNAWGGSASIARAPSDTLSFRVSGGYFDSEPFSRPVGRVPIIADPRVDNPVCNVTTGAGANCLGGAPYPADRQGVNAFENDGTSQPKIDGRLDHDLSNGARITYQAGYAGSEGIVHTGIGPFQLEDGAYMAYGKIGFSKGALRVGAFANFLDAEAPNLLLTDPTTLEPVALNFTTQTYDFEVGHSMVVGGHHVLSYGGNVRRNNFDITLTPNAEDRTELGAYFQDEIFWDKFRLAIGGRVDKFGNIEDPVFSPRVTAMFKPHAEHSFRASYNKAFRSPSAVNNYLDQKIFAPVAPIDLRPLIPLLPPPLAALVPRQPVRLIVNNVGNPDLKEESLTAYELAYTGTFGGRTTLGLAVYQNDTEDNINFTTITPSADFPQGGPGFDVYTPANSAETGIPGPLYAVLLQLRIPGFPLPRTVSTYLNLGPTRQRGFEASIDHRFNDTFSANANYSFQDTPEILEPEEDEIRFPVSELALPAKNRFNLGVSWNHPRFLGSASINFVDEALWVDVLTAPFHGFTDSYTMLNAAFGMKFVDGKVVATIKGTNLTNETIQQHVYGDVIKRSVFGELRFQF